MLTNRYGVGVPRADEFFNQQVFMKNLCSSAPLDTQLLAYRLKSARQKKRRAAEKNFGTV